MASSDFSWTLPPELDAKVRARIALMRDQDVVGRIWSGDASVWTSADENRWLGWLQLPSAERREIPRLAEFSKAIAADGTVDVVLLGMGGSSLAPEVIQSILRPGGRPALHVLDSTDPQQILQIDRRINFEKTIFIVASKSGSTLEVNILKQYFYTRAVEKLGAAPAGRRFVLTTDPGSKLEQVARDEHFREVFPGVPSVGGRYSALSNFGMVPAAAIGLDVAGMLDRAEAMARQCAAVDDQNSAFQLGVILGVLATEGRDKPTLITPPALASFGGWMEQLIAESLGKQGKGIIPIDGETPGPPAEYGHDRVFVHLRLASDPDAASDEIAQQLGRAGQPVVRIDWHDRDSLAAEFFRWEFATAVMGAVIGVNPFDQPDVEESKVVTRRIAGEYEKTGKLPDDTPLIDAGELVLYSDARGRSALGARTSAVDYLKAFLQQLHPGDYFALLAFIEMNGANHEVLQAIRQLVRDKMKVATTVGFGPRFLHSTGQAHKGGPNTGVFLQITAHSQDDVPVPGQRYSFGTIKLAQARGDFEVLSSRGRRVLRVHLRNATTGLPALRIAIERALA